MFALSVTYGFFMKKMRSELLTDQKDQELHEKFGGLGMRGW